jgi:VanZ family protein
MAEVLRNDYDFDALLIESQKEYVKFVGIKATLFIEMETKLQNYYRARLERMELLVKIESLKRKYMPNGAGPGERKRRLRRLRLKLEHFFRFGYFTLILHVLERMVASIIICVGWYV